MPASSKSKTDLLIIGAGPAGLMAAAWASKYNIPTRIIDDKPDRVKTGHADGLTCRTMELLDSFGLADIVQKESSQDIQMRSWISTLKSPLKRVATVRTQKAGVSRYQQCTLNQGRIEQLLQDLIEKQSNICVERNVKTLSLQMDEKLADSTSPDARPIALKVHHVAPDASGNMSVQKAETITSKYAIGCDGAHSWTRRQVRLELKGDTANAVWGVLDIVPLTDFPDIRQTCVIYSEEHGGIHLVPREGRLVRLYIQLVEAKDPQRRFDRASISPNELLKRAQRIFLPYKIDYKVCDWWSVYQVGQRIADDFSVKDRLFLAGDAIHTHSPKVGQGMNVSMADTYNLGWKISSVLRGILRHRVLSTYQSERRGVALALLEADRATNAYYSVHSKDEKAETEPRKDLQSFRDEMYDFLSGVSVEYGSSLIIDLDNPSENRSEGYTATNDAGSITKPGAATGGILVAAHKVKIGQRMPSCRIYNAADARPVWLLELLPSTGAWRILVFAGDLCNQDQMGRLQAVGTGISRADSCLAQHIGGAIELLTVCCGARGEVEVLSLPEIFHPWNERLGWDYSKVFSNKNSVSGNDEEDAYEILGIDINQGCIIVCRPDQHVGLKCGLDEWQRMEDYFKRFLV